MSRHCDGFNQQVFLLLLFTLHFTFFLALSADNPFWCHSDTVRDEANDVWIGHNFSKRFHLKDPLLETQILVWTKGNSTWVKRYNGQCKSDETCASSRYRMTEVTNVTFDLFIDYADQNDSGHHVVTLYQGKQLICTALNINLTVQTLEPICSTHLDKNDGKLQMFCQWVQMNEGDRAHFEVDSEILYEHQIPEMNFQGIFNITHWFSVNIGLHRLVEDIMKRSIKCIVSQRKGKVREMCNFLSLASKSFKQLEDTHSETVEFQCCVHKPDMPIPLLYDGDGQELPVSFRRNYSSRDNNSKFFFFCGAMEDNTVITIVHMKGLDISKSKKYGSLTFGVSVEDKKHFDNISRGHGRCKILTVTFTYLDSTSNNPDGISTKSLVTQNCDSVEVTKTFSNTMTSFSWTKNRGLLVAVAATVASVFAFIVGACITKCYYTYNINSKHHSLVRRDTSADLQREPSATEDDGVGALAMTTLTPKTPQQDDGTRFQSLAFNQTPSDEELQCFKQETIGPGPPTLPLRKEMIKDDSGGRSKGVKKSNGQQDAPICGAGIPVSDSMYCSVDDVKYMPSKVKHQDSHVKLNQSGLSLSRQKATRDDWKDTYSYTPDLDELYAKPDLSKKTKNKASLESEYDDPRPPENDFFHSILVQENDPPTHTLNTHHACHVYGNAVESHTDELTSDGELYINTAGSAFI